MMTSVPQTVGWRRQKLFSERLATLCDEAAEVPRDVVVDWSKCLPTITDGYGLADIYNAHEMGLYFRTLPSRSMVVCNDSRKGIQMYKEGKGVSEMCGISMNVYVRNELCIIMVCIKIKEIVIHIMCRLMKNL